MTIAAEDNLVILKGGYWTVEYTFLDDDEELDDLSAYTFQGEIRETSLPTSELLATFEFNETDLANGVLLGIIDDYARDIPAATEKGYFNIVGIATAGQPETFVYGETAFVDTPTEVT